MQKFLKCKSYAEIGRLLGYNYYNGTVKRKIIEFCNENNLNLDLIIKSNCNKPNKCLFCGKEIEGKARFTKKFCNSSCAAYFNNKGRKHSEETKEKIQISLLKLKNDIDDKPTLKKLIEDGLILNPLNAEYKNVYIPCFKWKKRTCIICGKEFKPSLTKNGNISKSKTCSKECHRKLVSINSRKVMERLISEGTHKGWKNRKIISYPENFWFTVLNNNNIEFKHNYYLNGYFLDFYIEINGTKIDLEIDGKQHKYKDRVESDKIRDAFIKSKGIEVYRVDWNSINTEKGSDLMKSKIDSFLSFYNTKI